MKSVMLDERKIYFLYLFSEAIRGLLLSYSYMVAIISYPFPGDPELFYAATWTILLINEKDPAILQIRAFFP